MATIMSFTYTYGNDGSNHSQATAVQREIPEDADLFDVLDFLGDALRAAGYTYVERVGISDDHGVMKWGKF